MSTFITRQSSKTDGNIIYAATNNQRTIEPTKGRQAIRHQPENNEGNIAWTIETQQSTVVNGPVVIIKTFDHNAQNNRLLHLNIIRTNIEPKPSEAYSNTAINLLQYIFNNKIRIIVRM
jgi:hypothetical protein